METKINISCPISAGKVDENVARTAAFYVIAFTIASLILHSYILIGLAAIDFGIRAFTTGDYSPLKFLSKRTALLLQLPQKPTDAAPKKFSAGLGMAFTLLIGIFIFLQIDIATYTTSGILFFCAVLEGGFGICLGCIVYSSIVLPFSNHKG